GRHGLLRMRNVELNSSSFRIPHSALEAPPDTILRNRATSSHAFAYLAVDFLGQAACQWQQVAVDQRGNELTWSTALRNPQQAHGSFRPACGIERREFQDCSTGAWPEGRCRSLSERNSPRSAISRGSRESSRIAIASISPKNWRRGSTRDFRSCSAGSLSESRKIRLRTVRVGSSSRRFRSFKIRRNRVQTSVSARKSSRRSPGRWSLWTTPQAISSRRFMLTFPRETCSQLRNS